MSKSHLEAFLETLRAHHNANPDRHEMVLTVLRIAQVLSVGKTICCLISLGHLPDNLPSTLLMYAASITGVNLIVSGLGFVALAIMAIDRVYTVFSALIIVFALVPGLFVSSVLQSVLTWRERGLLLASCMDSHGEGHTPYYPFPSIHFSSAKIPSSDGAADWCNGEWRANWKSSVRVIMITVPFLFFALALGVIYLQYFFRLFMSRDISPLTDPNNFKAAQAPELNERWAAIFITSMGSVVRATKSLTVIGDVIDNSKLAGYAYYIASVDLFVLFVLVASVITNYAVDVNAVLIALIMFLGLVCRTSFYPFITWYDKKLFLATCLESHGQSGGMRYPMYYRNYISGIRAESVEEAAQWCHDSWARSWVMGILLGTFWVGVGAWCMAQITLFPLRKTPTCDTKLALPKEEEVWVDVVDEKSGMSNEDQAGVLSQSGRDDEAGTWQIVN